MTTLNWTKTATGYAADGYSITRTPGRRWVVDYNGEPVGKQEPTLGTAKALAESDRLTRADDAINEPTPLEPRDFPAGTQQNPTEPLAWKLTETGMVPIFPAPPAKYRPVPAPRESLTEQYTRLDLYRDIRAGAFVIRRSYDRTAA